MSPAPPPYRSTADDLGRPVRLGAVRRVVSLVPSLTEAIAATAPGLLVGATDWCTHPADLEVARIGGTKNPHTARIIALAPDLVVANEEENRAPDLDALRAAGIPVWVTEVRTLDQALRSLERMLTTACGLPRPGWLDRAEAAWQAVQQGQDDGQDDGQDQDRALAAPVRAVVPIWRRPWMVLGRDTFAGDLLRRLGVHQLYADHAERYPAVPLDRLRAARPELVVLPDEPYRFTAEDGPEAFPGVPAALVSGRHLTWYGPSLAEAPAVVAAQLRRARPWDGPPPG
ncbi:ABC transporter substrate-binding protein [Streptacidiphilus sp. PB12-B1b]|uniref:helical backbone metal receptor n=1 Tax=Streptacidiphilus sp. PB12-B1b TaxID=2705012 RepID=UPI0015FCDBEE|nr:helical backbone metal receptor [Streptacidiphilus sp. PB12-B1b]QMU79788.1 ABC transporter substrate-binding protein [Streptacidiphilus sp. PB12-B1b]